MDNKIVNEIKKLTTYAIITIFLVLIPVNIASVLLYAFIGSTIGFNISKLFI